MSYRLIGALCLLLVVAAGDAAAQARQVDPCAGARDLRLTNGRIVTMDAARARSSRKPPSRTAGSSPSARRADRVSPCTRDDQPARTARRCPASSTTTTTSCCSASVRATTRRLESAATIADVQAALRARAQDRARRRVHHRRWAAGTRRSSPRSGCRRWPSSTRRLPNHPVLVFQAFTGPAATNTRGRAFFTERKVAVSDAGAIAANAPSLAALNALRAVQTFEDRKRGTIDAHELLGQRRRHHQRRHGCVHPARRRRTSQDSFDRRHAGHRRPVPDVRRDRRRCTASGGCRRGCASSS